MAGSHVRDHPGQQHSGAPSGESCQNGPCDGAAWGSAVPSCCSFATRVRGCTWRCGSGFGRRGLLEPRRCCPPCRGSEERPLPESAAPLCSARRAAGRPAVLACELAPPVGSGTAAAQHDCPVVWRLVPRAPELG